MNKKKAKAERLKSSRLSHPHSRGRQRDPLLLHPPIAHQNQNADDLQAGEGCWITLIARPSLGSYLLFPGDCFRYVRGAR